MEASHHSSSPGHCKLNREEGGQQEAQKTEELTRKQQGSSHGAQDLIIAPPLKSTLPQGRRWEIF